MKTLFIIYLYTHIIQIQLHIITMVIVYTKRYLLRLVSEYYYELYILHKNKENLKLSNLYATFYYKGAHSSHKSDFVRVD